MCSTVIDGRERQRSKDVSLLTIYAQVSNFELVFRELGLAQFYIVAPIVPSPLHVQYCGLITDEEQGTDKLVATSSVIWE